MSHTTIRYLSLALTMSMLYGCVSKVTVGKVLTATGSALIGFGVLDYVSDYDSNDCQEYTGPSDPAGLVPPARVSICRSSPSSEKSDNKGAEVVFVGFGAALAVTGVVLWVLGDQAESVTKPSNAIVPPPPGPLPPITEDPVVWLQTERTNRTSHSPSETDAGL
jgi:hypothetical protein